MALGELGIGLADRHRSGGGDVEAAADRDDHHHRVALERRRRHVRVPEARSPLVPAGEDREREDAVDLESRGELGRHLAPGHPRPQGADRVLERAAAVGPELAHPGLFALGQPHAQLLQLVGAIVARSGTVVGELRDFDEPVESGVEVALVPRRLDHLEPDLARVLLALEAARLDVGRHQVGAVGGDERGEERRIGSAQDGVLDPRGDPADQELSGEQDAAAVAVGEVGADALELLGRLGGTGLGRAHLSSIGCGRERRVTDGRRLRARGPPSTTNAAPVTNPAASEARYWTQAAMSTGWPTRPTACCSGDLVAGGGGIGLRVEVAAGHPGVDVAGADAVAADPVLAVLGSDRAGQRDHPTLGRAVGRQPGLDPETVDRGDVDDRAAAARAHRRDRGPRAAVDASQVDAHQPVPVLGLGVLDRLLDLDRRVVDEHVERSPALERGVGERPRLLRVADVGGPELDLVALGGERLGDRAPVVLGDVAHQHPRPGAGEVLGDPTADPGGRRR